MSASLAPTTGNPPDLPGGLTMWCRPLL